MTAAQDNAVKVWDRFCRRFGVVENSVPLFAVDQDGVVAQREIGRGNKRSVLARSPAMETLVLAETAKLVADWEAKTRLYEGLIYCVGWRDDARFVPLNIGKAETLGRGDGNLSANLKKLIKDRSKFGRWGDNYAHHVGDLSACVLPGHLAAKRVSKYQSWAATMFEPGPSPGPRLRRPVYFWTMAWEPSQSACGRNWGRRHSRSSSTF